MASRVGAIAERDSLNASILGPDAGAGHAEFDLFVKEVAREMTVKAGQKCTAIRRAMAPAEHLDAVQEALIERLAKVRIGDPREEGVQMGALASREQLESVREAVAELARSARIVAGNPDRSPVDGNGAFIEPILLRSDDPWGAPAIHDIEPFGPVSTIMPYQDLDDAIALANRGMGSLALSLFTFDPGVAESFVLGAGAYHGRMVILDRTSAKESTGHGSPLPVLVHGGPGRAGGGEEMGGIRGVTHYMQRTALQGSPDVLAADRRTVAAGRRQDRGRHPPVPQAHFRARDRLHAEDGEPHGHARGYRAFRRISPATISTPIWTRKRRRRTRSSTAASPTAI